MSYQPYPSTGASVEPDRGPAPQSVLYAVKLMYTGAAVSTVSLVISLASIGGTKDAIRKAKPSLREKLAARSPRGPGPSCPRSVSVPRRVQTEASSSRTGTSRRCA